MIRPVLKDDAFLADVRAANSADDNFRFWWLGQSGFLVQWKHRHLLLDPYLSDSLTTKYAATDKPHVRITERIVHPSRLDFIDVVTSSHYHTDHLDGETFGPLLEANPRIVMVAPPPPIGTSLPIGWVSPCRFPQGCAKASPPRSAPSDSPPCPPRTRN